MKILFFILIFKLCLFNLFSYESFPDSANVELSKQNDKEKLKTLLNWTWELRYTDQILAIKYGREALNLAENLKDYEAQAKVLNYIGVVFLHKADYKNAQIYFFEAKKISEKYKFYYQLGYSYNNLGHLMNFKGEFNEAIKMIYESKYYHEKANNTEGIAYSYIRLSEAFLGSKQFDSAYYYAFMAYNIRKNLNNIKNVHKALMTLGEALTELNKPDSALKIYWEIYKSVPEESRILVQIAYANFKKGLYDSSLYYAKKSFNIAKSISQYQVMVNSADIIKKSFVKKNKFDSAFVYSEIINQFKDTILAQEKVIQMKILEFLHDSDKRKEELKQLNYEANRNRYIIIFSAISFVILLVALLYIKNNHNKEKLTNKLLTEKNNEILKQSEKLNELNKTKDKFFSIIAHDLKNPLGNFKSTTDFLVKNYQNLTLEEQIEFINLLNGSATNIYSLLENLLEWSRSQRGIIEYQPTQFDLFFVVNNLISLLKIQLNNKEITITNKIPINTIAYGDVNMTTTILRNLLTNAIKFSNNNSQIEISCESKNNNYIVAVKDYGVGISEVVIHKLFRIDTNFSTEGTNKEKGTGLGLILCKEFVEKMGGNIWVESEVGQGTTFYFTLKKS